MLILTVKGYELPVCLSLAQGQAVIELMKTLMYQKVDDWHECASWRKCWGTLVHSKWQCPETQFTALHLFSPSVALSPGAYCPHNHAELREYYIELLHFNHQRNFSGMVFDGQPKPIILWMCDYAQKGFSIYNSEHPEKIKRNHC